jgi:repressor LexA
MENKKIFATNLQKYMELNEKSRKDISDALGISYYTVTDWVKGKKYPRMDKVEMLAEYFGVLKSDLIEDKTNMQKKNDVKTDIVSRMFDDELFLSIVEDLNKLDATQLLSIRQMLTAFVK